MKRLENKFDRILEWQLNGDGSPLPEDLQIQWDRLDYADRLISNYHINDDSLERPQNFSFNEIAKMIVVRFGCSLATANRDIRESQLLLGQSRKLDDDYWTNILLGMGMDALQLLVKKKRPEEVLKGVERIAKILGLPKDKTKIPDWGNLQPNKYVFIMQVSKKEAYELDLEESHKLPEGHVDKIITQMIQSEEIEFTHV